MTLIDLSGKFARQFGISEEVGQRSGAGEPADSLKEMGIQTPIVSALKLFSHWHCNDQFRVRITDKENHNRKMPAAHGNRGSPLLSLVIVN